MRMVAAVVLLLPMGCRPVAPDVDGKPSGESGTTTTTGLTVTMVRDPVTKDFALEAGALVLGDGRTVVGALRVGAVRAATPDPSGTPGAGRPNGT